MAITLDGTNGIITPGVTDSGALSVSGTTTLSTGILNIGSGQIYKDASGNLGIGTTTINAKLHVNNATGGGSSSYFTDSTTGTSSGFQVGLDSGHNAILNMQYNAQMLFSTNNVERARIDSSGNLLVGTTTAPTQGKMNVVNGFQMTGASTGTAISSNNGSAEVAYLTLGASYNVAGVYDVALGIVNIATTAGKRIVIQNRTAGVYVADGGTSWTSNSDERLKTDLKPIENATQKVSTLRAVTGRFKTDEQGVSRSFLIAQDVQAVLPEAVDASDPDKLGVAYTDTIPLLVAAIKELTARLEALENK